jgi:soluble lytic murein transglycosylase-like protein
VQLANGFTMRCDHHALVDGHMRLYPHAGNSEFLDLAPSSVVGFRELVPDASPKVAAALSQTATGTLRLEDLRQLLVSAGHEHDLDVDLLASIIEAESSNHPHAVSRAGAEGLMQLMPATAQELGVRNAFAPEDNVHGGAAYLDWLLARYHDNLALALAAYNAGPAAVDRFHGIPPYRETQIYVARVIHLFNERVNQRARERVAERRSRERAATITDQSAGQTADQATNQATNPVANPATMLHPR